jgi:YD repeat-containing protein
MATVLRWLALAAPLLTACGEEIAGPPDDLGPPLPGVVPQSAGPVPGAEYPTSSRPGDRSCITRYDFTGGIADAECLTASVDGDPLHWTTSCPAHDRLTDQVEVLVDEAGRRLFDATREDVREWTRTLTYDDLDRLIEIRFDTENEATGNSVLTFTAFNERGQPLHMTRTGDVWDLGPLSFPGNDQVGSYAYDARGRLTDHEVRFVANDATYLDMHIVYDDAARRRNWDVEVDTSSFDGGSGPGVNGRSELFDEENRLVESERFSPPGTVGTRDTSVSRYRYDDEGRLLTTLFEERAYGTELQYTAHEIYDCP